MVYLLSVVKWIVTEKNIYVLVLILKMFHLEMFKFDDHFLTLDLATLVTYTFSNWKQFNIAIIANINI